MKPFHESSSNTVMLIFFKGCLSETETDFQLHLFNQSDVCHIHVHPCALFNLIPFLAAVLTHARRMRSHEYSFGSANKGPKQAVCVL